MGSHPLNLAIRFALELCALASVGLWGWRQQQGWLRFLLAAGLPLLLAALWVTFAVPDDPSRSGNAPVPTPGALRLLLELGIFACAVWALHDLSYHTLTWVLGGVVLLHYITSYDRILWLLKQ